MKKILAGIVVLFLLLNISPIKSQSLSTKTKQTYNEYIVYFPTKNSFTANSFKTSLEKSKNFNLVEFSNLSNGSIAVIKTELSDKNLISSTIKTLKSEFKGAIIEPNYTYKALGIHNDPLFAKQWALKSTVDINYAKAKKKGLITSTTPVIVAVVDTGVDTTHKDLKNKMYRDSNGEIIGYDFIKNKKEVKDKSGHGTHVAGIIAAEQDNNAGIVGICNSCKIMPITTLGPSGGSLTNVIKGIDFAINNGAQVINLSLGGRAYSSALEDITSQAINKKIFVVAAAGNDENNDRIAFPAGNWGVISVAAYNTNNKLTTYSSYSGNVDFIAPGGEYDYNNPNCFYNPATTIISTLPENSIIAKEILKACPSQLISQKGTYGSIPGTSMASPHIAGVIALARSHYPSIQYKELVAMVMKSSTQFIQSGRQNNTLPANVKIRAFKPDLYKLLSNNFDDSDNLRIGDSVVTYQSGSILEFDFTLRMNVKHFYTKQPGQYTLELKSLDKCIIYNGPREFTFNINNYFNWNNLSFPIDMYYTSCDMIHGAKFKFVLRNSAGEVIDKRTIYEFSWT